MALIQETGAIVLNANTYVTRAQADTYHLEMGRETTWVDLDEELKDRYLLQACQQMEARYRTLWKGKKRNDNDAVTQRLSWPRKDVKDEDEYEVDDQTVPELVRTAQMEIAFILSQGKEFVQAEIDVGEQKIKSETIGPISTEYFDNRMSGSTWPFLDQMLEPLTGGISAIKLGGHIHLTDEELEALELRDVADLLADPDWFIQG